MKTINEHIYKLLGYGKHVVYEIYLDKNEVGFLTGLYLREVGNCYWLIDVDGEYLVYNRELGNLNNPYKFDPPVVFFNKLRVIFVNQENRENIAECVIEGFVMTK